MGNWMVLGRTEQTLRMRSASTMPVKMQVSGYGEVVIEFPGESESDVRATVIAWLDNEIMSEGGEPDDVSGDWRTVQATLDGSRSFLTFRASWVSGFRIGAR